MATSLSLSQQQKQMLKLSPAQIQVMRLLELPTCELIAHINEELQTNPALEEGVDQPGYSDFAGKTISILGASISTFAGTSNGAAADTTR